MNIDIMNVTVYPNTRLNTYKIIGKNIFIQIKKYYENICTYIIMRLYYHIN